MADFAIVGGQLHCLPCSAQIQPAPGMSDEEAQLAHIAAKHLR